MVGKDGKMRLMWCDGQDANDDDGGDGNDDNNNDNY